MVTINVFLSHKMKGLDEKEITEIRRKAMIEVTSIIRSEKLYGGDYKIHIIDNYHHWDAPKDASRLWHLGESIKQMGDADYIYFCKGWMKAKGCWVERFIAWLYKLKVM